MFFQGSRTVRNAVNVACKANHCTVTFGRGSNNVRKIVLREIAKNTVMFVNRRVSQMSNQFGEFNLSRRLSQMSFTDFRRSARGKSQHRSLPSAVRKESRAQRSVAGSMRSRRIPRAGSGYDLRGSGSIFQNPNFREGEELPDFEEEENQEKAGEDGGEDNYIGEEDEREEFDEKDEFDEREEKEEEEEEEEEERGGFDEKDEEGDEDEDVEEDSDQKDLVEEDDDDAFETYEEWS